MRSPREGAGRFRGLVLGVGNLLLQDEGVGVHVVQALSRVVESPGGALPPGTKVVDGGTLGLDLLPLLEDADAVVFVDAANLGREPGTVAVLRDADLATALASHLSAHQVGLGDLLAAARLMGSLPAQVALVAIQPANIAPGLELTPDVAGALPEAVELARAEARAQARTLSAAGPASRSTATTRSRSRSGRRSPSDATSLTDRSATPPPIR